MEKITKTMFKEMYNAGELKLICGGVKRTKEEILSKIKEIEHKIEEYCKEVSNYGNIESDKNGIQTCNIYISDCENYIFVEHVIDCSKERTYLGNDVVVYNTVYLTC